MKKALMLSVFAVAVLRSVAAPSALDQLSPEERARYVKARKEMSRLPTAERIRRSGGLLYQASTGKVVRVVNAQKLVDPKCMYPMMDGYKVVMGIPLLYADGTFEEGSVFDVVKKGFAIPKTAAVLALVDDPAAPRILCAPEEPWAAVNVRALAADNPSREVLEKRVLKESWRSMSIALGASDSMYRPCLLSPTHTLADLDDNPSLVVSPEPFSHIMMNANAIGIGKVKQFTYRVACRQGWAPPPTNDVQKAIWDEIHQLPTKPIRIKPETQRK